MVLMLFIPLSGPVLTNMINDLLTVDSDTTLVLHSMDLF